jgi:hypothetical protein
LLHVLFSSWFIIQFFFPQVGVRLSRGLCWSIPGVAVGMPHDTYLLTCWSASLKQVRSQCLAAREASWFLHISWHGEAMCGLGVWGCQSFASSWWFFLPGVSPVSQQDFYFTDLYISYFIYLFIGCWAPKHIPLLVSSDAINMGVQVSFVCWLMLLPIYAQEWYNRVL